MYKIIIFFLINTTLIYANNKEYITYPQFYAGSISGYNINTLKYVTKYIYTKVGIGNEAQDDDMREYYNYNYITASIGIPIIELYTKIPINNKANSMIYGYNINFNFRINKNALFGVFIGYQTNMAYKYKLNKDTYGNLALGVQAGYVFGDNISKDKINTINSTSFMILDILRSFFSIFSDTREYHYYDNERTYFFD